MIALVVVLVLVAVAMAVMWRMDRKRKFGGGVPSAEDERRNAEQSIDHQRWINGPGGIGGP